MDSTVRLYNDRPGLLDSDGSHTGMTQSSSIVASTCGEAAFLRRLFDGLRASGIVYAVMRNYGDLPETAGGSDLDLLVSPRGSRSVREAIEQAMNCTGAVLVGSSRSPTLLKMFILGSGDRTSGWGLRIDVNLGLSYRGAAYAAFDRVSRAIVEHHGIAVLSPPVAAVVGVLKDLLHNATITSRYQGGAAHAVEREWAVIEDIFSAIGPNGLANLRAAILAGPDDPHADERAQELRRNLMRRGLVASPVGYLGARVAHEASKVWRFVSPSGALIAVMGVDGVGKSTVIRDVQPLLAAATHGALVTKHLRPGLLPPLAWFKGERHVAGAPVVTPHGSKPSGTLGSIARVAYYTADYVLGYWLTIRRHIARQPAVWLFDRYAYDMSIDPRRFRVALPARVCRWFTALAPRPDLILCLHADAATIARRKQELSALEIDRQLAALETFARREPRAVLVSTEGTPEQATERVLSALRTFFVTRALRKDGARLARST